jgi:ferredoxin
MALAMAGQYTIGLACGTRQSYDLRMRVTVEVGLCEANAVCAGLVPEVFFVDEDDELHILKSEVPPEFAEGVREAVRACPKMALLLEE